MTEQKLKRDEIMEGKKGIKEKDLNEEGGFGYRNKKVGEDTRAQVMSHTAFSSRFAIAT
jgi:hypothetical protein